MSAPSCDGFNESDNGGCSPAHAGCYLGGLLKCAREQCGLTLEQIAQETKIPAPRLAVLEDDTRASLPRGFYERAQMRAYARAVNLGDNVLEVELERESALVLPALVPVPAADGGEQAPISTRMLTVMAVAGVLVVAAAVWASRNRELREGGATSAESRVHVTAAVRDQRAPRAALAEQTSGPAPLRSEALQGSAPAGAVQPTTGVSSEPRLAQTPPPSRPFVSELIVTTEPAGARVTVDGVGWGTTPITIRHLSPGAKRIRFTKEGYDAAERVVRVIAARPSSLDVQLSAIP